MAPKSLDHFKRGYQERADQRDKEFYAARSGAAGSHVVGGGNRRERRDGIDPWARKSQERPIHLHGLEIIAFLDRVTAIQNDKKRVFAELSKARESYPEAFNGGKGLTVLISAAARRCNIKMAQLVWDWMDEVKVSKNTFHYNSMISATEKAKNHRHALDLVREMEERNVPKNEVT
jgi:pentatricopeptide repeat protein